MIAPLPIAEARRRLSELVRKVVANRQVIPIGKRGRAEVVLAPMTASIRALERKPLRGLIQIVGDGDIDAGKAELRRSIGDSLEKTTRELCARSTRRAKGRGRQVS